jgi:hypothetical protein
MQRDRRGPRGTFPEQPIAELSAFLARIAPDLSNWGALERSRLRARLAGGRCNPLMSKPRIN